jgi:hypothetical protein
MLSIVTATTWWATPRRRIAAAIPTGPAASQQNWLKRADGDVMAIVHSGVVRAALTAFLGLTQDRIAPVGNGAGAILNFAEVTSPFAKLEGFNLGSFSQDAHAFASR